jgi:hypothetical protein
MRGKECALSKKEYVTTELQRMYFEAGYHSVTQADLKFVILPPPSPEWRGYRHGPPHSAFKERMYKEIKVTMTVLSAYFFFQELHQLL